MKQEKIMVLGEYYETEITDKYKKSKLWRPPNENYVLAIIPGTILDVIAEVGQVLKAGDTLLILEAMKMENCIVMPFGGEIEEICVQKGKLVAKNDVLVKIKPS